MDAPVRPYDFLTIGCPHCFSLPVSCHVCHGTGRCSYWAGERAVTWMWATEGCGCGACKDAGPPRATTVAA